MKDLDTAKLKSALIDAAILKAQAMIETQTEPVTSSRTHLLWMRDLLHTGKPPRKKWTTKQRLVALLVAALFLLLTSCAVRGLIDFFVTRFDKYDRVEQGAFADYSLMLKTNKLLNLSFSDYQIVGIDEGAFIIRIKWEKTDGSSIIIAQGVRNDVSRYFDNEYGKATIMEKEGVQIFYYLQDVHKHVYIWLGEYEFFIESSRELTSEELSYIINNTK